MEVLGKLVEKLDTSSWGQVNEADEVMAQLGRVPAPNLMTLVPLLGPPLWKERIYSHTLYSDLHICTPNIHNT